MVKKAIVDPQMLVEWEYQMGLVTDHWLLLLKVEILRDKMTIHLLANLSSNIRYGDDKDYFILLVYQFLIFFLYFPQQNVGLLSNIVIDIGTEADGPLLQKQ